MAGRKNQFNLSDKQIEAAAKTGREKTQKAYAEKADIIAKGYPTSSKKTGAIGSSNTGKKNQFSGKRTTGDGATRVDQVMAAAINSTLSAFQKLAADSTSSTGSLSMGESARAAINEAKTAKKEGRQVRLGQAQRKAEQDKIKRFNDGWAGDFKQKLLEGAQKSAESAYESERHAKEGLGKFGQGVVDFGIAGAQFAGDALLNAVAPGAGLAAMAGRAYGSASLDAQQRGLSEGEQQISGLKSAAIEMLTEKLFGSVSKVAYGKGIIRNESLVNSLVNRLAKTDRGRTALKVLVGANEEGMEEVLSDILNPIADRILKLDDGKGDWSDLADDYDTQQMLEDYIIGGALGLAGAGTNVVSGQYRAENAQQRAYEEYQRQLVNAGLATEQGGDAQLTAEKYKNILDQSTQRGKRNLSDKETANLESLIRGTYAQEDASDVSTRLAQLGTDASEQTVNAIVKAVNGETLSRAEQKAFDANPYSQRVVNEMLDTEGVTSNEWYADRASAQSFTPEVSSGINIEQAQNVLDTSTANNPQFVNSMARQYKVAPEVVERTYNLNPTAPQAFETAFNAVYQMGQQGTDKAALGKVPVLSTAQANIAYQMGADSVMSTETAAPVTNNNTQEVNDNGVRIHNVAERINGQNTEGQIRGVETGTGENVAGRSQKEQGGAGAAQIKAGEKVSYKGKQQKGVYYAAEDTEDMKKGRKLAESYGYKVIYFVGGNIRYAGGEFRGAVDTAKKTVMVRADHPDYTAEQIMRHEMGHAAFENGDLSIDEAREMLLDEFTADELNELIEIYNSEYGGILSAEEAFEEICCDALGRMNIFEGTDLNSESYGKAQDTVRKYATERTGSKGRAPPKKGGVKYSFENASEEAKWQAKVNSAMTMDEAKRMLESTFKICEIRRYSDGEYQNAEQWLREAGSEEVEMYIYNEWSLQEKYMNNNEDILNEEYNLSDVLDAYLEGTLIGKEKPKAKRMDTSKSYGLRDDRFYAPQKIENAKEFLTLANQKLTATNRNAVNNARAKVLLFAHNKGAAELLGMSQAELNKKLRSWSAYSAQAKRISEEANRGVAEENRWTGIENCAYISKTAVSDEEIERLTGEIKGKPNGYEKRYIARVMLAADTHISYKRLKFVFESKRDVNARFGNPNGRINGFYSPGNAEVPDTIVCSYGAPETVAHEMGHYIDTRWGRDLVGSNSGALFLTRGVNEDIIRARHGEDGIQFVRNFNIFINSLMDVNTAISSYTNDHAEVFARFFAKFVEWTDNIATGSKTYSYESNMYGDKFTQSQYVEFIKLLQEKSMLDAKYEASQGREKFSREQPSKTIKVSKQTWAQIQNRRMLKYGNKFDTMPSMDYIFANDNLFVINNYDAASFAVTRKIDPAKDKVLADKIVEALKNGSIETTRDFDRWAKVLRNNARRGNGDNVHAGNRRTAGGNAQLDDRAERTADRGSAADKSSGGNGVNYSREPERLNELRRQNERKLAQATAEDAANENERGLIRDYQKQYSKVEDIREKLSAAQQALTEAEDSGADYDTTIKAKNRFTVLSNQYAREHRKLESYANMKALQNVLARVDERLGNDLPEGMGAASANFTGEETVGERWVTEAQGKGDSALHPISKEQEANLAEQQQRAPQEIPKEDLNGKLTSKHVSTIANSGMTPAEFSDALREDAALGKFSHIAYSDEEALKKANRTIEIDGWEQALANYKAEINSGRVSKDNTVMGIALYNNAVNSGDYATAMDIASLMVKNSTNTAQSLQAMRILNKLSPECRLYLAAKSIENIEEDLNERYKDNKADIHVDKILYDEYAKALRQGDEDGIKTAWANIEQSVAQQIDATWYEKLNNFRYLAMLGNPRTHVRNIVGNAFFVPVRAVKNTIAYGLENIADAKINGGIERSKAILNSSNAADAALVKYAMSDYEAVQEVILSGGKYVDTFQGIDKHRTIYKTKILEAARKGNSAALDAEDAWFCKPAYANALAKWYKANGITAEQLNTGKVPEETIIKAQTTAIKEAQKATYRDTNWFSAQVSRLGKVDNKVAAMLIEGVLPFKKTPANILARAVEYSPVGLIKSLALDTKKVKAYVNGDIENGMSPAEFIDDISAGLTGSALMGLGILLASWGVLSGGDDDDEKQNYFDELSGKQNYALSIGGMSITLDWLAPESMPLFVGVELFNSLSSKNEDKGFLQNLMSSVMSLSTPMFEMSMLQSVNDLFDNLAYIKQGQGTFKIVSSMAANYISQYFPTLFGQGERAFGETQRETTYVDRNSAVGSELQYMWGKIANKIPFYDFSQIPYIDAWGRTEETGNLFERMLNNFVNPAYVKKERPTEIDGELERLYDLGETSVYPSRAKTNTKINGEYLTADEYVKYATTKGQTSYELAQGVINSAAYSGASDPEKAYMLKYVYSYADHIAKYEVNNDYSLAKWEMEAYKSANPMQAIIDHAREYYNPDKEN